MNPALCAQPGCQAGVDSLPAYMCADCGQRFCDEHLWLNAAGVEVCGRCYDTALARRSRAPGLVLLAVWVLIIIGAAMALAYCAATT